MNLFSHRIYTNRPSNTWTDAYPLGNGRIGAMIFGRTNHEMIPLNEDTLWAGVPRTITKDSFYDDYMKTRQLIDEGKYAEATDYASQHLGVADNNNY